MATIVLGDDHVVFLDAVSTVLAQHGHSVRAVAPGAPELVESVRSLQPDVCLIHRYFDVDDSADVISRVVAAGDGTRVIVLGGDPDSAAALWALDAGASGYVHKSRGVAALISAVERVLLGSVVMDIPPATEVRRSARANGAERLPIRLTARERECLAMLVEGLDTAAMVVKLGVSRTTVRTHVQAVLNKLGVHSRLEAASFAVRSGILGVGYDDILLRKRRPDVPAFVELTSGGGPANGSRRIAIESAAEPRRAFPAVRAPGPRPRLAHPPDAPVSTADRAG